MLLESRRPHGEGKALVSWWGSITREWAALLGVWVLVRAAWGVSEVAISLVDDWPS